MELHVVRVGILALLLNLLAISMEPAAGNPPTHDLEDEVCIVTLGGRTCADTGKSICAYLKKINGDVCPNASICHYCNSEQGNMPEEQCVGFKGGTCPWNGGPHKHCVGLKFAGNCSVVNGKCTCINGGPPIACHTTVPGC